MGIRQIPDIVFEQHHDGKPRRLLASFHHFKHALVGNSQTNHRRNRLSLGVRCDDIEPCHITRRVLLCTWGDFDLQAIGWLTKDQAFGQRPAIVVQDSCDQHAIGRIRRREHCVSQASGTLGEIQLCNFGFALPQTHRTRPVIAHSHFHDHRFSGFVDILAGLNDRPWHHFG